MIERNKDMAKYEVKFSCGHTATVELFGKGTERERKIAYFEKYGICPECYKAEKEEERKHNEEEYAKKHDEVEMLYRDYKNNYSKYRTKTDSYNADTKTIIVYLPKKND